MPVYEMLFSQSTLSVLILGCSQNSTVEGKIDTDINSMSMVNFIKYFVIEKPNIKTGG